MDVAGVKATPIPIPYCGEGPAPWELVGRWNVDPFLLLMLGGACIMLATVGRKWPPRQRHALGIALITLVFLYISPFCALGSSLFAARAIHHVILAAMVAPLLVIAIRPDAIRVPGHVAFWTGVHTLIFWLWHAPSAYSWALSNNFAFWLMQLSILLSAMGFWWAARRSGAPAAVGGLLVQMVQMGLLGALIVFAAGPLYPPHFLAPLEWGLSPLEDQQLGGLLMWAPGAGIYLAAAMIFLGRWLRRPAIS